MRNSRSNLALRLADGLGGVVVYLYEGVRASMKVALVSVVLLCLVIRAGGHGLRYGGGISGCRAIK